MFVACGCNPVGTLAGSHCTAYGGQCPCLPGVVGRTCDSCDIGFYGFSAAGCKRKLTKLFDMTKKTLSRVSFNVFLTHVT